MKKRWDLLVIVILAVLALLIIVAIYFQEQIFPSPGTESPPTFQQFYGTIKDASGSLVANALVYAESGGNVVTSQQTASGVYGNSSSSPFIINNLEQGASINFYVNASDKSVLVSTVSFSDMSLTELNLNFYYCGDGVCNSGETSSSCSADCPPSGDDSGDDGGGDDSGCTPICTGKSCGQDNGCGGKCIIQSCAAGSYCNSTGSCVVNASSCTPNCAGKTCGSDCCSGSCGACSSGSCTNGVCTTTPNNGEETPQTSTTNWKLILSAGAGVIIILAVVSYFYLRNPKTPIKIKPKEKFEFKPNKIVVEKRKK